MPHMKQEFYGQKNDDSNAWQTLDIMNYDNKFIDNFPLGSISHRNLGIYHQDST